MSARVNAVALGARIRELRERRGWTQLQLGEAIGMRVPHVSRLESGGAVPSLDTMVRVALALGWRSTMVALRDVVGDGTTKPPTAP